MVVDDVALPLGRIRVRAHGSDGGHNGLRSLVAALGTEEFARVRIGVGLPERRRSWTSRISSSRSSCRRSSRGCARSPGSRPTPSLCLLQEGAPAAMNRFNGRRV